SRFASLAFIPPYWLRQRWKVCSLISRRCTTWAIVLPVASIASASRNLVMICSGECRLRFIYESLQSPAGAHRDSHTNWFRFWAAGHPFGLDHSKSLTARERRTAVFRPHARFLLLAELSGRPRHLPKDV